jgi:hypothetical protein
VTAAGGLIHSFNAFIADEPENWGCVLKVADISQEELLEAIKPHVTKVLDVRKM